MSAPASAMNTNTTRGHVLCNKSAKWLNVRGQSRVESCQDVTEKMLLITNYQVRGSCADTVRCQIGKLLSFYV